jgi:nitric oxide reductase NorD protein
VRTPDADEDDTRSGPSMVPIQDGQESVEDPLGLNRPLDRDTDADPGGLADALAELPEARLVHRETPASEVLTSEDSPARSAVRLSRVASDGGEHVYREWDWTTGTYIPAGARVVTVPRGRGESSWPETVLRDRAPLVRTIHRSFERLRARRYRLTRQTDGPEIDLDAWVESATSRRAGQVQVNEDRLYERVAPLRRDLAILLLADVSASTDACVEGTRRVIDVEKEGLLLVTEALERLREPFAILAFSSDGPERVRLLCVKRFEETPGPGVRNAIAALEPDGFTRMGAAIRHATTVLERAHARHRLMLVLSDGKPNDVDRYEGRYGIEDTRMAVLEARAAGIATFCVTVDRQASSYLPRIFQRSGFMLVPRATALPGALLGALRRMLAS